jgi:hypothetical protein
MATVKINADLSANPEKISIRGGQTVSWEGDEEFAIHLPAPYRNPAISPNGGKFAGASDPFPAQADVYTIHYTITRAGHVADPEIEVQP